MERVIVTTLEETPEDATHWSTRSLAKTTGMSQSAISRIWRAFGLKPWMVEDFKLSADPQFIDKVCDIVGLGLNHPEAAVVVCVDEKTYSSWLNLVERWFSELTTKWIRRGTAARSPNSKTRSNTGSTPVTTTLPPHLAQDRRPDPRHSRRAYCQRISDSGH